MLKKSDPQMDFITNEVCKHLIPEDHLLVKVSEINYSKRGRGSKDPVMMFKILLLGYLYMLSDVQVSKRIMSDVAFRWFLGLKLTDPTPDDTTISHFRIHRLSDSDIQEVFNKIVDICISAGLVKTNRYIIDTTDVAANVNYPSEKKLVRQSITKLAKEISSFNPELSQSLLNDYQSALDNLYDQSSEAINAKQHFEIARQLIKKLDVIEDLPKSNEPFQNAYNLCLELIEDYLDGTTDRIVSVVDKDARVAHKTVMGDLNLKPKEVSADKVYGTIDNRVFLDKNRIVGNIDFYNESTKEKKVYGISDFRFSIEATNK